MASSTEVAVMDAKDQASSEKLYPLLEGAPDALVIRCCDPRFGLAFDLFVREGLGVKVPCTIAVPGSISSYGASAYLPKAWSALRGHIELMTGLIKFPRVILINHDDCRGYAKVAEYLSRKISLTENQEKHLQDLAGFIRNEYLPGAKFELYQAHIVEQGGTRKVGFEKVA